MNVEAFEIPDNRRALRWNLEMSTFFNLSLYSLLIIACLASPTTLKFDCLLLIEYMIRRSIFISFFDLLGFVSPLVKVGFYDLTQSSSLTYQKKQRPLLLDTSSKT